MARRRTIHLIPHFHYDIEYLIPVEPYLESCFENLLEAHRLLSKYPNYAYMVEQVYLLEQFFAEYPSLKANFRKWAAEGRFEVSAGMYAMADINMPSGESLIRQLAIGKEWCEKNLGLEPRVLNMADCSGHNAQMPQIAAQCGYDYFVFMRSVDNAARKSEILWQGIDGSVLRTYWLPGGYAGWVRWFPYTEDLHPPMPKEIGPSSKLVSTVLRHAISDGVILGTSGDFVAPYERGIEEAAAWNRAHPHARIVYSTYARALKSMAWSKAPRHAGEWNPDFAGTYSSRIRLKQGNRASEALLMTAEAVSALARQRLGIAPDQDGLLRAWKLACVNQFHDICWGTVIDRAYGHALDRIKRVRVITQNIIESRLASILDSVPAQDEGSRRIIAFNPLPWARKADIEIPADRRAVGMGSLHKAGDEPGRTLRVELPPCGYRILVAPAAGAGSPPERTPFAWTTQRDGRSLRIGGPFYSATISAAGVISSLVRRKDRVEFVDRRRPWSGMLCWQTDHGDLWQIDDTLPRGEGEVMLQSQVERDPYPIPPKSGKYGYRTHGFGVDNRMAPARKVFVRENSADRLVIGIQGTLGINWPDFREFKGSGISIAYDQTVTFHADSPRIDFHLRTRHERGSWYRLRVAFFTDIRNGTITHEIPFGSLRRPEGQFAAQNYVAYCGEKKGLALFNRGLPGNNVADGVMMLSLMRSVAFPATAVSSTSLEEGEEHAFEYALLPFGGKKEFHSASLAREGMEFNVPPYVYEKDPMLLSVRAGGNASLQDRFLELTPGSVCCTAVYPAANGIVVRLFESRGAAAHSVLQPNFRVSSARETDALLRNPRELPLRAGKLALSFKPFEIKTILLR